MKTKICTDCDENHLILYRIQIEKSGKWFFVCKNCIEKHQPKPHYRYGGTWNGKRH